MHRLFALVLVVVLAACSTVGINTSPSGRALDPLRDDIASLVIAFDLPRGLGPAPGSLFTFDVANGGPAEHLRLALQPADIDAAGGNLPPPGAGRAYYVFGFSETDRASIRNAQAAAVARGASAANVKLGLVPHLCTSGGVDANQATVSMTAALPGQSRLLPFIDHQLLAELLQQPGSTQMPPCA